MCVMGPSESEEIDFCFGVSMLYFDTKSILKNVQARLANRSTIWVRSFAGRSLLDVRHRTLLGLDKDLHRTRKIFVVQSDLYTRKRRISQKDRKEQKMRFIPPPSSQESAAICKTLLRLVDNILQKGRSCQIRSIFHKRSEKQNLHAITFIPR